MTGQVIVKKKLLKENQLAIGNFNSKLVIERIPIQHIS